MIEKFWNKLNNAIKAYTKLYSIRVAWRTQEMYIRNSQQERMQILNKTIKKKKIAQECEIIFFFFFAANNFHSGLSFAVFNTFGIRITEKKENTYLNYLPCFTTIFYFVKSRES